MHIQWIDITLPPLKDIHFDCDKQVNLFIGPNSSGKSTIIRAIQDLSSSWDEFDSGNAYPLYRRARVNIGVNYGCPLDTAYYPQGADCAGSGASIWEAVPFLYIPATRINLPGRQVFDPTRYEREQIIADNALESLFETNPGIFRGEHVETALFQLRHKMTEQESQAVLRKAIETGYTCAKSICNEVIYDDRPHWFYEQDDFPSGRIIALPAMGISTSGNILEEPLYAGVLSSGTQGTLLWIWALSLKMADHYRWQEGWEKKPAILLIDEIENHLHPTWQRRVIPALLEHFPGLQIFATTHSPFVVAGLKAGQVHLLKRDENTGVVTHTRNTEDIIGWTADEILRSWMGVDEPTDQLTVDRADRMRQLRNQDTLTSEEESELNELRRQVNESLLSKGGPLEAQRERYADLMQRFLLSRQSDLSQDGK